MPPAKPDSRGQRTALGAGLTFALTVALFTWGGHWLDDKWGTGPWLLLLGAALGSVGGFLHLIAVVAPEMFPFRKKEPRP
jgi:uncharacterized membrane protein YcjF (UPF0283 family)